MMGSDESRWLPTRDGPLCRCNFFELWYIGVEDHTHYCVCGHGAEEHADRKYVCTGEVEILPGIR
jgi:hypothetical protein